MGGPVPLLLLAAACLAGAPQEGAYTGSHGLTPVALVHDPSPGCCGSRGSQHLAASGEAGGIRPSGKSFAVSPSGQLLVRLPPVANRSGAQAIADRVPRPGRAFLLSALLPGAGQRNLGRDRWTAYAAAEIWAWLQFLDRRRAGKRLQRQYRDLAWYVARRVSSGPRSDAGWDYYEALAHFRASGAYDADPLAPGVQPEDDPDTFNGSVWMLAREIFLPEDPEIPTGPGSEAYRRALDYYLSRAYPPDLAWNWGSNSLHQHEYTDLIRKSDENLRRSTTMIGVILANHLLSAVDAFVTGRLDAVGHEDARVALTVDNGPLRAPRLWISLTLSTGAFDDF